MNLFDGRYFDRDYYENGIATGKSCYENYRWLPLRSFKEAIAFIDYSGIDEDSYVLDVGCAKGFLVMALNQLGISAAGCDISEYALGIMRFISWDAKIEENWTQRKDKYTHATVKDVFEHCDKKQLIKLLSLVKLVSQRLVCVVPIGNNGKYNIPEYHKDKSHVIIEPKAWWIDQFFSAGWCVVKSCNHINGLKDNYAYNENGNHVFYMERLCG